MDYSRDVVPYFPESVTKTQEASRIYRGLLDKAMDAYIALIAIGVSGRRSYNTIDTFVREDF